MPATNRRLDIVPEPEDEDAARAARLRELLIGQRERDKLEMAEVRIPRRQAFVTDSEGHDILDSDGREIVGPLVLYFRRLNPETMAAIRADNTKRTPVRRGGQMTYDESIDNVAFAQDWAYRSMLPWCRQRYFDDQSLWGNEPVGTGFEYFQRYLTESERAACVDAVIQLQHADETHAELLGGELLGKGSETPDPQSK